MELNIGSNIFRDTNGVLMVEGKQQIELEVGDDGQVLLTMDVYDSGGEHIAKLRRNAWAFNKQDRFGITTPPSSLKLINILADELVLEVQVTSRTAVSVPRGRFFTHSGHEIQIEPDVLRIADMTLVGNEFRANNQAINIEGS